ncbi:hypothetical protein BDV30DRAFT_202587 [Aspergillus minisclerotigenes]|uniref:Uncharacterized protein n=1 Tax=Aspergillus minisclerotigenes TaxID=656917 RepID=A0A5N6JIP3_9EURO|nr:hypothetical protein BDV30DRAFT_202587 [Aspergillus minisclerotigenes]
MNTTVNWGVRLRRSRFSRLGESWYLSGGCTGQMKSLLFFFLFFFSHGDFHACGMGLCSASSEIRDNVRSTCWTDLSSGPTMGRAVCNRLPC